jgi:hypothetical protein
LASCGNDVQRGERIAIVAERAGIRPTRTYILIIRHTIGIIIRLTIARTVDPKSSHKVIGGQRVAIIAGLPGDQASLQGARIADIRIAILIGIRLAHALARSSHTVQRGKGVAIIARLSGVRAAGALVVGIWHPVPIRIRLPHTLAIAIHRIQCGKRITIVTRSSGVRPSRAHIAHIGYAIAIAIRLPNTLAVSSDHIQRRQGVPIVTRRTRLRAIDTDIFKVRGPIPIGVLELGLQAHRPDIEASSSHMVSTLHITIGTIRITGDHISTISSSLYPVRIVAIGAAQRALPFQFSIGVQLDHPIVGTTFEFQNIPPGGYAAESRTDPTQDHDPAILRASNGETRLTTVATICTLPENIPS